MVASCPRKHGVERGDVVAQIGRNAAVSIEQSVVVVVPVGVDRKRAGRADGIEDCPYHGVRTAKDATDRTKPGVNHDGIAFDEPEVLQLAGQNASRPEGCRRHVSARLRG